jgi:hypothetical protein
VQPRYEIFVGQAVKAVSSNAGFGEATRQSKGLRDAWLAAVKRRIKAGDLRNMRSGVKDCADRGQVVGLMQRRSGSSSANASSVSRSRRIGASNLIPPWTTRCPIPVTGVREKRSAAVVSISRAAAS